MLRLEEHGPDVYVGVGPDYPWGGLYGGQIVAQGRASNAPVKTLAVVGGTGAYVGAHGELVLTELGNAENTGTLRITLERR